MFNYLYKLVNKKPVLCASTSEWADWYEHAERIVNYHHFTIEGQAVEITTAFIGIDYSVYMGGNKPRLFETMIFGGEFNGKRFLSSTWEEAEMQHETALQLIFTVTA
jgi:hypothetical protein